MRYREIRPWVGALGCILALSLGLFAVWLGNFWSPRPGSFLYSLMLEPSRLHRHRGPQFRPRLPADGSGMVAVPQDSPWGSRTHTRDSPSPMDPELGLGPPGAAEGDRARIGSPGYAPPYGSLGVPPVWLSESSDSPRRGGSVLPRLKEGERPAGYSQMGASSYTVVLDDNTSPATVHFRRSPTQDRYYSP